MRVGQTYVREEDWTETTWATEAKQPPMLTYSLASGWMSKRPLQSIMTMAKGKDTKRWGSCQARLRPSGSQTERTEKPAQKKSQREKWDHRPCHLSLSTYCTLCSFSPLFLFLSCTQKENTDIFVTSPRRASEWSLDTEIWGSKSTGQPCMPDKKRGWLCQHGSYSECKSCCMGRKTREERGVNVRGTKRWPCNPLQWRKLKGKCNGDGQNERRVAVPALYPWAL